MPKNSNHDLCYECYSNIHDRDDDTPSTSKFERDLKSLRINTVYIMFYGRGEYKIGFTNDLPSRFIEIKRDFPNNQLVYFREFSDETTARTFEAWLKTLSDRSINKFVSEFQSKIARVHRLS